MAKYKRTPEQNAKLSATLRAKGLANTPTKVCPRCKRELPREEFGKRYNGYSPSLCKPCSAEKAREYRAKALASDNAAEIRERERRSNRRTQLRKKYGITPEDYDAMLAEQGGVCAVCGGLPDRDRDHFDVDHCHKTGIVRGLLCSSCNRSIGLLGDDPDRILRAALYVELYVPSEVIHGE